MNTHNTKKAIKKLSVILLATLSITANEAMAVCPSNIFGRYIGYQTKYDGVGTVSNVVNKVFVINFTTAGVAKVLSNAKTSLAEPIGLVIGLGDTNSYKYDALTCTARMWNPAVGSTASDVYFVVGDSGKTIYGIAQDVGQNETRTEVLTKQ
jgi:hypothetical protein